jgi:SagB-type dehydrogenase family enzyme
VTAAASAAVAYHEATKYAPDNIHQHPGLDWARQPVPFKQYHAAAPIELAAFLPLDPNPFTGAVGSAPEPGSAGDLDRRALSRWIYFTYGVTAVVPQQPRPLYLRAAPSAGGLYPAECYVVVREELDGVAPGLYGYDPLHHRLASLWPGPEVAAGLDAACYGNAAVQAAPVCLVVTGVFARSSWRYRERAYRRVLLDSGHLLGNAGMAAGALGLRVHLTAAFCDDTLNALLRVDADEEGALAVMALNRPGTAERPAWAVLPSPQAAYDGSTPMLQALHRAGSLGSERPRLVQRGESQAEELERRYSAASGASLDYDAGDCPLAGGIFDTILHRRSTRRYERQPLELEQLARLLACAYEPEAVGLAPQPTLDRGELMTFIAVADVTGLPTGVYYFAPHSRSLRRLRDGLERDAVQYLCLGQELGGDAAVTVFHTADLPRCVARLGDRAYRSLHLDAGILGQRLNLAALADGLGASGIGGFFDDRVNALLGIPAEQAVVYITTIGIAS